MPKETTPPQNNPPPFCCDCRRFIDSTDPGANAPDVPRCNLSQMVEVIRGTKFYPPCELMRNNSSPCGFAGKHFERKQLFKPEIVIENGN
jgi:hypothetical protein